MFTYTFPPLTLLEIGNASIELDGLDEGIHYNYDEDDSEIGENTGEYGGGAEDVDEDKVGNDDQAEYTQDYGEGEEEEDVNTAEWGEAPGEDEDNGDGGSDDVQDDYNGDDGGEAEEGENTYEYA